MEKKWYEKNWVIWLFIIFLWPVGLFMLWKYSSHGMVIKGIVTAFFLLIGIGAFNGKSSESINHDKTSYSSEKVVQSEQPKQKNYHTVNISTMMDDLQDNAAAAQKKYKGQDLAVTGRVEVIDSDGDYITLMPNEFSIVGIHCSVNARDKNQEDFVLNVRKGQTVTAYGRVTNVGEVLGYSMKVDYFQ